VRCGHIPSWGSMLLRSTRSNSDRPCRAAYLSAVTVVTDVAHDDNVRSPNTRSNMANLGCRRAARLLLPWEHFGGFPPPLIRNGHVVVDIDGGELDGVVWEQPIVKSSCRRGVGLDVAASRLGTIPRASDDRIVRSLAITQRVIVTSLEQRRCSDDYISTGLHNLLVTAIAMLRGDLAAHFDNGIAGDGAGSLSATNVFELTLPLDSRWSRSGPGRA
jgi:hypothetical protein